MPPTELIPYSTLTKAKEFFDQGGVVVGYGFLPSKSATLGKSSKQIAALCRAIWGEAIVPATKACRINAAGGRSYLLPEIPKPEEITASLTADAGVRPALEVLQGETGNWLHVLHRVRAGHDVFFVCNQNHTGDARRFRFNVEAAGTPECWDAMRNEITRVPHQRRGNRVEIDLTLQPNESVLLVFQDQPRPLPPRASEEAAPKTVIPVEADASVRVEKTAVIPEKHRPHTASPVEGSIFSGRCEIPAGLELAKARVYLELDALGGKPQRLEIRKAIYGPTPHKNGAKGNVDVTAKVAGLVADNQLMVTADNEVSDGKDPAYGIRKSLRVEYLVDGKPLVATTGQNGLIAIPQGVEKAACITINGQYAGGFIEKPFRLDVTRHVKSGANTVRIAPWGSKSVRLVVYP